MTPTEGDDPIQQAAAAGIRRALSQYLEANGQDPAFHVEPSGPDDSDLAEAVATMMPTMADLYLHPDQPDEVMEGEAESYRFRPWVDHLIEGMAAHVAHQVRQEGLLT